VVRVAEKTSSLISEEDRLFEELYILIALE